MRETEAKTSNSADSIHSNCDQSNCSPGNAPIPSSRRVTEDGATRKTEESAGRVLEIDSPGESAAAFVFTTESGDVLATEGSDPFVSEGATANG